jgi:hypothetical protein
MRTASFEILEYALQECARLDIQRRGLMDFDHAVRHSSKVMNVYRQNLKRRNKSADFPMHVLTANLVRDLGLPESMVGMGVSKDMFWRCHARLQAIHAGRIPA